MRIRTFLGAGAILAMATVLTIPKPVLAPGTESECEVTIRTDLAWVESVFDSTSGGFVPYNPGDSTFTPPQPVAGSTRRIIPCP